MSDKHIQDEVFCQNKVRIFAKEFTQGDERFNGEMTIFRGVNFRQEVFDAKSKISLARSHLRQEGGAIHAVSPLELVANHQSGTVLQGFPNAGIKSRRHLSKGAPTTAMVQPAAGRGGRRPGRRPRLGDVGMPLDIDTRLDVERFLTLE